MHDHPWNFISIILKGGYVEYREKTEFDPLAIEGLDDTHPVWIETRIYHPGQILFRKATDKHKLEIHQHAITLVITFKKIRNWGFWTPKGFVGWQQYEPSNKCE